MEQRRFILFLTLSMALLMGWSILIAPPPEERRPQDPAAQQAEAEQDGELRDEQEEREQPPDREDVAAADLDEADESAENGREPIDEDEALRPDVADLKQRLEQDPQQVVLGSDEPQSGYFAKITLTTRGAAVETIELNDPRYRELRRRDRPLKVVGSTNGRTDLRTLDTSARAFNDRLVEIDRGFAGIDWLRDANWEVVAESQSPSGVTFRLLSPDGDMEVRKRYEFEPVVVEGRDQRETRDTSASGYKLDVHLTLVNLGDERRDVSYTLQGPVGVPLENVENTRKYRDLRMGFHGENGKLTTSSMASGAVVDQALEGRFEEWKNPIQYIGVDVQYFAALLVPQENQLHEPYIDLAQPVLVERAPDKSRSDISVELTSHVLSLAGGEEVTHSYSLFAGPKREALLAEFHAADVMDYGWFETVARGMLWLLKFLHDKAAIPYGIAIIFLTVLVRGCLFPLSRKQVMGAKKMKELQPKIVELKKKYKNEKEKMARAQMELFSKHNYNPFAGCLPIFLQLPIFIGLYNALNNSVDLRMASFLWIDNLAAPDALVELGWWMPFLGIIDFNVLPLLTVSLFVVQQKMFMPPPTDEQQAMQYKMMNYMMIFMGFLFYKVPAGLCVYFIASSLWGIGERKLLDYITPASPDPDTLPEKDKEKEKKPGLWSKLLEAADAAAEGRSKPAGAGSAAKAEAAASGKQPSNGQRPPGGKKKKKSRSRK